MRTGKLRPAAQAGPLTEVALTGITHVLPGGGWMVEYLEYGVTLVSYPIIASRVSASGFLGPVSINSEGPSRSACTPC